MLKHRPGLSVDPQQDSASENNPNMLRSENDTGRNSKSMHRIA